MFKQTYEVVLVFFSLGYRPKKLKDDLFAFIQGRQGRDNIDKVLLAFL